MNLTFNALLDGVIQSIKVASIELWKRIMIWGHLSILPWVKRRIPNFYSFAEEAFIVLDKTVGFAKELAKRVIDAWKALRTRLLKQEIKIERNNNGTYVRQVVNWTYEPKEEKTVQREVIEEIISADDLPFLQITIERQRELLRTKSFELNMTEIRDQEVLEYEQAI